MNIIEEIQKLKKEKNAVILAHNYQIGEIQDIADFTGDSLGLSIEAANTQADVIVFCGVHFMAETANILSPDKTVLIPDKSAGCPMADMITADQLADLKAKHPDALVVCYVNSTAEVKALSDYCCTSGNAVEVVKSMPQDREIIFVPDKNLGSFVKQKAQREMILWPGYCPSHARIMTDDIEQKKKQYPNAIVLAHPECNDDVKDIADKLFSTGQMLQYAKANDCQEFIIVTEPGIVHSLEKENPSKKFYEATDKAVCPNMKKITVEKVLWALQEMQYVVKVQDDIAAKAKACLDRMISIVPK